MIFFGPSAIRFKANPRNIENIIRGKIMSVSRLMRAFGITPTSLKDKETPLKAQLTVPSTYVANVVSSYSEIISRGYTITPTTNIINCPVVPENSTASKRMGGGSTGLNKGWYKGQVCFYFTFEEKALTAVGGNVPTSPIYVTFNINPNLAGGGPPSGFVVEPGTMQTHNVLATVPSNGSYSPLWSVNMYDNASFGSVNNLASAQAATVLVPNAALVNCPTVQ